MIDLLCMPDTQHARGGAGTVHHIAFRTPDDASQRACRDQLVELGFNVSPGGRPQQTS
jgi:glyoxalase family protein